MRPLELTGYPVKRFFIILEWQNSMIRPRISVMHIIPSSYMHTYRLNLFYMVCDLLTCLMWRST